MSLLPRWSGRLSLATILAVSLGTLMLVSVGSVSLITLGTAGRNTFDLLQDKAVLTLASIEQSVRQHLDPVVAQAAYLKGLIEAAPPGTPDLARIAADLKAALAATPQVTGLGFVMAGTGRMVRVLRGGDAVEEDWTAVSDIAGIVDLARAGPTIGWRPPVWNPALKQTIIPFAQPVLREGRLFGVLVSAVTTRQLSAYVAGLSTPDQTTFILYGRDLVLAHPTLAGGDPAASSARALPPLATFRDPELASMWSDRRRRIDLGPQAGGNAGHIVDFEDGYWFYIYRSLDAYGERPWIIGADVPERALGREIDRLQTIAILTALLLVGAVVVAVLFGRRIAAPMAAVARVARSVERLDLAGTSRLPGSRVKEIDEAGRALNSMVSALRWFELYLPRRLVHQLLEKGEGASRAPAEQAVTVMFTDIRGFSRMSARMPAAAAADFLNEHLALVGACVEDTGGTIDKYIGDSVMAFWGAPEPQPDHAAQACDAARRISVAIRAENARRRAQDREPVCIRIGLATGAALVGNIGAPGRLNYTLVGDVVNVAQRLEQLGKEIDGTCEVIALATELGRAGACSYAATGALALGVRTLRDREGEVAVFRVL